MEMLEIIALALAFGGEEFKCPFEHRPLKARENKIPPQHANKSGILGTAIKKERIKERTADSAYLAQRKEEKGGGEVKVTKYGYSPHHIIPGNEIWNKEGGDSHPIRAWIDKETTGSKVNGDIGYINNAKYNGIDLPSHHKFSRIADWSASEEMQYDYAKGAMDAAAEDGAESRQFHDSHKAYSDMVWKALEKNNVRLNMLAKEGKCEDEFPVNIPKI
jgi:hypothetical protein